MDKELYKYVINNKREGENIVGMYFGAFDPFHEGHKEVIETALENYCTHIICGIVKKSKSKPNLMYYGHRYNIMKKELEKKRVYLVDAMNFNINIKNIIKYIETIIENVKFYEIIGSDVFLKSMKEGFKEYRRVDKYLIVPRDQCNNTNNNTNNNSNNSNKYIWMDKKLFSKGYAMLLNSTSIRNNISHNKEVSILHLSTDSQTYLQEHMLYSDNINIVKQYILSLTNNINYKCNIQNLSRNFSGHHVYKIIPCNSYNCIDYNNDNNVNNNNDNNNNDNNNVNNDNSIKQHEYLAYPYIIKIFTDYNRGYIETNILRFMNTKNIPTIDVKDFTSFKKLSIACYSFFNGESFDIVIKTSSFEKIERWAFLIGKYIRSFHDCNYIIPSSDMIKYCIDRFTFNDSTHSFFKDPGVFSQYIHSDLNISNILVNDHGICFIDPDSYPYPGPPAFDYYWFLSSLKNLRLSLKSTITKYFKLGYGTPNFTPSSHLFFSNYCNVKISN